MKIRTSSRGILRTIYNAFALIVVISMLAAGIPQAQARGELGKTINTKALALAICTDNGRGSAKLNNGKDSFIGTEHGKPIRVSPSLKHGSASDVAQGFLSECGGALSAQSQSSEFAPTHENHSQNGKHSSVKFQQSFNGIPVLAGEMFVELDENSDVLAVGGETLSSIDLDTNPSVDSATAQATALTHVAKDHGIDSSTLSTTEPELWIYDPSMLTPYDGPTALVWRMDVRSDDPAFPVNQLTLVDAHLGNVVLSFNQESFGYETRVYDYANGTTRPSTDVCHRIDTVDTAPDDNPLNVAYDDTLGTCDNSADATIRLVQQNVQDAYNYFNNVLQHDGPLGNGLNGETNVITVGVHYGIATYYDQWSGDMIFGNGTYNGTQLDIVGHEYAHKVINHTTSLFQFYQSGAIAESIADIYGELMQDKVNGGTGVNPDWLVGGVGGRNMATPYTMTDLGNYFSSTPSANCLGNNSDGGYDSYDANCDNGGIHTINHLNNYVAHQLAAANWPNEFIAALYYEALSSTLTSGSDYGALDAALKQACNNLQGLQIGQDSYGFTSTISLTDCDTLTAILGSVGMATQPASGGSPDAPYCDDTSFVPQNIFNDDMEISDVTSLNWVTSTNGVVDTTGTPSWNRVPYNSAYLSTYQSANAMFASDRNASQESTLTNAAGIPINSSLTNAFLYFKHYYQFDNGNAADENFDGGILEYRTTSNQFAWGNTWTKVENGPWGTGLETTGSQTSMVDGYNGVAAGTNPIFPAQLGFVNDSHGYVGTRVDITSLIPPALTNRWVEFRWRMSTDASGYDLGWYIDDVTVYHCDPAPLITYNTVTYRSVKAQDGQIIESGETTNKGGTVSRLSTLFNVGDNYQDRQYLGILSFNTSSLPDTAVVTNAKLCIKKYSQVGNNSPFTWGNGFTVDVKTGFYGGLATLVSGDFQGLNSAANISTFSSTPTVSQCVSSLPNWYYSNVSAAGPYMNLVGTTQFKLRFVLDDNDDKTNDYLRFYTGENLTYAPKLIITYYVP